MQRVYICSSKDCTFFALQIKGHPSIKGPCFHATYSITCPMMSGCLLINRSLCQGRVLVTLPPLLFSSLFTRLWYLSFWLSACRCVFVSSISPNNGRWEWQYSLLLSNFHFHHRMRTIIMFLSILFRTKAYPGYYANMCQGITGILHKPHHYWDDWDM